MMEITKETETDNKKLIYHSCYGTDVKVSLDIQMYYSNRNICIELNDEDYNEPYGCLTVNLCDATPNYCSYVDVNNMQEAEDFIVENKLGFFTGLVKESGFVRYPLYMFDAERLRELCPDGMIVYERGKGIQPVQKQQEEKR